MEATGDQSEKVDRFDKYSDIYWYASYHDLMVGPNGELTGDFLDYYTPDNEFSVESGLPRGVIIPNGYKYLKEIREYIKATKHNVYVAKHCDDANTVTHIQESGNVNCFGWFITDMDVLSVKPHWCLDIGGPGWLRRVTVQDIREVEKYIALD